MEVDESSNVMQRLQYSDAANSTKRVARLQVPRNQDSGKGKRKAEDNDALSEKEEEDFVSDLLDIDSPIGPRGFLRPQGIESLRDAKPTSKLPPPSSAGLLKPKKKKKHMLAERGASRHGKMERTT